MEKFMRSLRQIIGPLVLTVALVGLSTGCTAKIRANRHLSRADKFLADGKLPQAEIEYKNTLKLDPLNPHAIGKLGIIYFEEGRVTRAYPFLTKAIELNPKDPDLLVKSALLYLAVGDVTNAQKQAAATLALSPTNSDAPLVLAESARTTNDVQTIRAQLEKIRKQTGDTPSLLVALGTLSFRTGDLKTAEADFNQAVKLDPKSAAAHNAIGTLYWAQNNLTNAETELKTAADLSPLRSNRKLHYADFKLKTGHVEEGKSILAKITKDAPDYLPAWVNLAEIAFTQKDYTNCASLIASAFRADPDNPQVSLLNTRLLLAQKETDKAVTELERLSAILKTSPQVFYQLAVAYGLKNDTAKALKSVNQAVSLNPNYDEALLLQAQLNIQRDSPDLAITSLNQLIKRQPALAQAYLLLTSAYAKKGDLDSALATCDKLQKLYPKNAQVPLLAGNLLLQQKKTAEARSSFEKSMELAPDFYPPFEQLVNLDVSAKNFDAAEKRIFDKEKEQPKSPVLPTLLARVYAAQSETNKAESALLDAIKLDPDYQPPYLLLANLYVTSDRNDKALETLKQSLEKNPKDVAAWMLMGTIQSDKKDFAASRDSYEKLLDINPNFAPALNNVAYLYSEKLGQLDKAYDAAKKARDLSGNDPYTGDTLGWILYKRKDYAQALPLLQDSASKLSTQPEVQFHLGMVYYAMADQDRAKSTLTRALSFNQDFNGKQDAQQRLDLLNLDTKKGGANALAILQKRVADQPDDAIALLKIAEIYDQQGDSEKAVNAYEEALKQNPKNGRVMLALATLYSKNPQDSAKALEMAKDAYKAAPDDPDVSYALGKLVFADGEYKYAASLFQQSALKRSDDPELSYDLARALYNIGRVSDAEDTMRKLVQPDVSFSRKSQASQFLDLLAIAENPGNTSADDPRIKQALQSDPTNAPALMAVAAIAQAKGDSKAASAAYDKILARYPDFTPAIRQMAIYLVANPANDSRTYDLATKARQAYPSDKEIARTLGMLSYRRGDFRSAARLLNESLPDASPNGQTLYYIGMAQYQLKNTKESKAALTQALGTNLPGQLATEAKRVLAELK